MSGFGAFFGKELREVRKTWRLWVLPGLLVFLGVTSPIMTAATPAIIKATTRTMPGVVLNFPTPTTGDAYAEFMGNLAQLALLAIIVTGAATVAGERSRGTAALVLTKPLTRAAFLAAKTLAGVVLLTAATLLGAALCALVTILLFDAGLLRQFAASVALWLALAALFTALMVLLSAATGRSAPAAAAGIGIYVAVFVLTGLPVIRDHSPAGLMAANDAIIRGREVALLWPLLTTAGLSVLCVLGAIVVFRRKEL